MAITRNRDQKQKHCHAYQGKMELVKERWY